jgi:hypothetical protein
MEDWIPDDPDWIPDELSAEPESSGLIRRGIGDPAISALKGAIGLPEAMVGLADIPTLGAAGKAVKGLGIDFKGAREGLDTMLSPEQQQLNREVQETKGFFPTIGAALERPSTIAHTVIESAPSMIGGGAIGRGLLKVAPKIGAIVGGAIGEGAISAGQSAEQIRQESESGFLNPKQAAIVAASGTLTSLFGLMGGKLANRLGILDIDTLMAGGVPADIKKGILKRIIGGAISEGAFEELPQSLQEQVAQNISLGKPAGEGVAEAGAMGMLAGAVMGAAGGGGGSLLSKPQKTPVQKALESDPLASQLETAIAENDPDGVTKPPVWTGEGVPVRQPSQPVIDESNIWRGKSAEESAQVFEETRAQEERIRQSPQGKIKLREQLATLENELRTEFASKEPEMIVSGLTPADMRGIEESVFKEWNAKAKSEQYSEPYLRELYAGLEDNAFKLFAQKAAQADYTSPPIEEFPPPKKYSSKKEAIVSIKAKKLNPDDYDIEKSGNKWIAKLKEKVVEEIPPIVEGAGAAGVRAKIAASRQAPVRQASIDETQGQAIPTQAGKAVEPKAETRHTMTEIEIDEYPDYVKSIQLVKEAQKSGEHIFVYPDAETLRYISGKTRPEGVKHFEVFPDGKVEVVTPAKATAPKPAEPTLSKAPTIEKTEKAGKGKAETGAVKVETEFSDISGEKVVEVTEPKVEETKAKEENRLEKLDEAKTEYTLEDGSPILVNEIFYNTDFKNDKRKTAIDLLKKMRSLVPEFNKAPVFTVVDGGFLEFKDNYVFRFLPDALGVDKEQVKNGDKIRVDLEGLIEGKKKDTFYAKNPDGWKKQTGEKFNIEGYPDLDFFISKGKYRRSTVTEGRSGLSVGDFYNPKDELKTFLDRAKENGEDIYELIKNKSGGEISPLYLPKAEQKKALKEARIKKLKNSLEKEMPEAEAADTTKADTKFSISKQKGVTIDESGINIIRSELETEIGRRIGDGIITQVLYIPESASVQGRLQPIPQRSGRIPTGENEELHDNVSKTSEYDSRQIQKIAGTFGKQIIWIKIADPVLSKGINGIVTDKLPDKIFINIASTDPHLIVLGHELIHKIQFESPELYEELKGYLIPQMDNIDEFKSLRQDSEKKIGILNRIEDSRVYEELISEFSGEQFINKEFWDDMAEVNPTLFEKVAQIAKQIIIKAMNTLGINSNVISKKYFKDINKSRKMLADVMNKYAKEKGKPKDITKTDEGLRLSVSLSSPEHYKQSISDNIQAFKAAWKDRSVYQKNPGFIENAFRIVFGSPELSNHPVMQALSDTFIERNAWFNENFKAFADIGDFPELKKEETWTQTLDGLTDEQYEAFLELDKELDEGGYLQSEARVHMDKMKTDPVIREAWEAKTARMNKVWDTHMSIIRSELNEIEERALVKEVQPVYPIVSWEIDEKTGKFDMNKPVTLKDVYDIMGEIKEYAYSPRIREHGKYVVRALMPSQGREYMKFAKNLVEAEKLKIQLQDEGWGNISISEDTKSMPESVLAGLKEMDIVQIINSAMNKTDNEAVSDAFGKEITDAVHSIILARGYRRHTIGRKTKIVEGYETDPRKKTMTYFTNTAAGLAKTKAAKQAVQIMAGGINEGTPEGYRISKLLGEYHKKPIRAEEENTLYESAKTYISDNLRNIEDADRAIAFVKKLATFKYLAYTLRAPLVNTTALITTVLPSIHQYATEGKGNFTDIMKEIGIAGRDYVNVMRGKRGFLSHSEQQFIDEINRKEYDDPQMVRDMMTSMQSTSGRTFDNIIQWGMIPFKATEQWMRGLTMLAGYRVARKNGMSITDAREAGVKAAGRAHGTYGKATRQYWAQGTHPAARIGQVATTFLKFPQNYLNLLYDLGYEKKNIKAFTWALAAPIVLGGAAAIPFKDNIVWMINALMKGLDDDRDIEKMVYDDVRLYFGAETEKNLRTGLMGAAGMDITGSLSMNLGLPTDLLSLTGIFGGMAKETYKAGHFVRTGQYSKALETALPSGLGNIFKAIRELDGATTSTGGRVWNEDGTPYIPSSGETALRLAGFRGSTRTTTQQRAWESTREEDRWHDSRNKIYERYKSYLAKGARSEDEFKSVMYDVSKFNKAIIARGRVGMVAFIKPQQLRKITRDMMRQPKSELRKKMAR